MLEKLKKLQSQNLVGNIETYIDQRYKLAWLRNII